MCTFHSVMVGQRHNNPLNPRCFCLQRPRVMELAPNPRYSGGSKPLGGSFILVTPAPKPVREMSQLLSRETKKDLGTWTNSSNTNKYTKYKPRLNTQKHTRPNRAVWTGPGSCAHGKLPMYILNARDHFYCSPLLFSRTATHNRCGQTEGVQVLTTKQKQRTCIKL